MNIFLKQDEILDYLYNALNKNGRINTLIYNCYEYGKLTPKKEKINTFQKLMELSLDNRRSMCEIIKKRKRKKV